MGEGRRGKGAGRRSTGLVDGVLERDEQASSGSLRRKQVATLVGDEEALEAEAHGTRAAGGLTLVARGRHVRELGGAGTRWLWTATRRG